MRNGCDGEERNGMENRMMKIQHTNDVASHSHKHYIIRVGVIFSVLNKNIYIHFMIFITKTKTNIQKM